MRLTVVSVRGSRHGRQEKRKKAWKPPDPKRYKRQDESKMRDKHQKKRRVPLIEMLPSEILERIFLMSENFDFPRSSLAIGKALSARTHLLELVVTAFQPTWELWFGCPKNQIVSYDGYGRDLGRLGGNPGFQTAVLACNWINLSLILDAKQIWYRRFGKGRFFHHAEDWGFSSEDGHPPVPNHPHGGQDHGKDVHACAVADWDAFLSARVEMSNFFRYAYNRKRYSTGCIDIHPDTKIPDKLFLGPTFTRETAKLLFWLTHGGARLAPNQTWEVTKLGFDRLMAHTSDELVLTFLWLFAMVGVFGSHWPLYILESVIEELRLGEKAARLSRTIPRSVVYARQIMEYHVEVRNRAIQI